MYPWDTKKDPQRALLHCVFNNRILFHDSIRPADLAFVPGRLFHYLLDADLPLQS